MSEEKEITVAEQPLPDDKPESAEKHDKVEHHPAKQSSGGTGAFLATIIALSAIGISVYLWQQQKVVRNDVKALEGSINRLVEVVEQRDTLQRERVETLAQHQHPQSDEHLARLEAMILELRSRLSQERSDWLLAEVEYLLRVADHRLTLEKDPHTAIAALHQSVQKLALLHHPALLTVVEQINSDIAALRAISMPDTAKISSDLAALSAELTHWPFANGDNRTLPISSGGQPSAEEGEPASGMRQMLDKIWADIKGLVTIRRNEEVSRPLMDTEQRYFLQQNLRLKLESARLALLSGYNQAYHDSLNEAQSWLKQYYDIESPAVSAAIDTIERLDQINLTPQLPSLEQSLLSLQQAVIEIQTSQAEQGTPEISTQPETDTEVPPAIDTVPLNGTLGTEIVPAPPPVSGESPETADEHIESQTDEVPPVDYPEAALPSPVKPLTEEQSEQSAPSSSPNAITPQTSPSEQPSEPAAPPAAPSEEVPADDVPTPSQGISL